MTTRKAGAALAAEIAGMAALLGIFGAVALLPAACSGPAHADTRKPPGWETVTDGTGDAEDVETFCDHGNRVYLDHNGMHGIAVAARDPSCAGVTR